MLIFPLKKEWYTKRQAEIKVIAWAEIPVYGVE